MIAQAGNARVLLLVILTFPSSTSFSPSGQLNDLSKMALFSSTVSATSENFESRLCLPPRKLLVHWRGEDVEGYSMAFRRPEFLGALAGVTGIPLDEDAPINFQNALNYDGDTYMSEVKLKAFNEAMQWMTLSTSVTLDASSLSRETISLAVSRCALINTVYEVVAEGESYDELSINAIENGGFNDLMKSGENERDTWSLRVRQYGHQSDAKKERRYSERTRSYTMEKEVLLALKPMLLKFRGSVDLNDPDCKIYVFDGLSGSKVLARTMAQGPQNVSCKSVYEGHALVLTKQSDLLSTCQRCSFSPWPQRHGSVSPRHRWSRLPPSVCATLQAFRTGSEYSTPSLDPAPYFLRPP
jgi:hypothetical protein